MSSKHKSRIRYAFLFLLTCAFVLFTVFLIRCISTFGTELFDKNSYLATTACARIYQSYLEEAASLSLSDLSIEVRSDADARIDTISLSPESPSDSPLFLDCWIVFRDGSMAEYTNHSENERRQANSQALARCFYSTGMDDGNHSKMEVEGMTSYIPNHLPVLRWNLGTGKEIVSYTIQTFLSPIYMDRHTPFLVEQFLFHTFRTVMVPFLGIYPLLLLLIFLLIRSLQTTDTETVSSDKKIGLIAFPTFFFWDFDFLCFLLAACLAILFPLQFISYAAAWLIALASTALALFFFLRFLREIRGHSKDMASHLFLCQLKKQGNELFLCFLILVFLCIPVGIAGYLPTELRWILYLTEALILLFVLAGFFRLLSIKTRIQNLADTAEPEEYPPLPWPFASAETSLRQIRHDFMLAADEHLKGERLKAELITNFSHDLKTPLTSILNYIQLLKKSLPSDPAYDNYIHILEQKSLQLKDLTENLLELSRLSSGNEPAHLEPCDFVEIIRQANGEFAEPMEQQHLILKSHLPSDPIYVMIDRGKMWRILENLYGNVVKYAMKETRVYVDLLKNMDTVTVRIRNISKEELLLPPTNLIERYVRGSSRDSDGNGLGLSTVQTLASLQGGVFTLDIQGDLFTVSVSLPLNQGTSAPSK